MSTARWRLVGMAVLATGTLLAGLAQPAQAEVEPDLSPTALRDQLIRSAPPGSAARVDPATGRVVLRVPDTAANALSSSVRRHRGRVVLETGPGMARSLGGGIVGGHEIDGPLGPCSSGFGVRDAAGRDYLLTAGHCTAAAGRWRRNGNRMGWSAGSVHGRNGDFGLVEVTDRYHAQPRVNHEYNNVLTTQPVWGVEQLPLNSTAHLCKMGRTTRTTCGDILAYDVTVVNSDGVLVQGLLETNLCARPGDSGGAAYTSRYVANPPGAMAVGIAVIGNANCANPNNRTWLQPVTTALDWFGVTLMTT